MDYHCFRCPIWWWSRFFHGWSASVSRSPTFGTILGSFCEKVAKNMQEALRSKNNQILWIFNTHIVFFTQPGSVSWHDEKVDFSTFHENRKKLMLDEVNGWNQLKIQILREKIHRFIILDHFWTRNDSRKRRVKNRKFHVFGFRCVDGAQESWSGGDHMIFHRKVATPKFRNFVFGNSKK